MKAKTYIIVEHLVCNKYNQDESVELHSYIMTFKEFNKAKENIKKNSKVVKYDETTYDTITYETANEEHKLKIQEGLSHVRFKSSMLLRQPEKVDTSFRDCCDHISDIYY